MLNRPVFLVGAERSGTTMLRLMLDHHSKLSWCSEFVGVPFDAAMLEYDRDTTYSKPDPKLTQQWRRKLSDREVQQVESRISRQLTSTGYELSGLPTLHVSAAQRRKLRIHSWWVMLNFRRKRYGFALWLSDLVVRRMGSTAMKNRMRINRVVTQHLK